MPAAGCVSFTSNSVDLTACFCHAPLCNDQNFKNALATDVALNFHGETMSERAQGRANDIKQSAKAAYLQAKNFFINSSATTLTSVRPPIQIVVVTMAAVLSLVWRRVGQELSDVVHLLLNQCTYCY